MLMVSGETPDSDEGSMRLSMARSYGTSAVAVEGPRSMFVHIVVLLIVMLATSPACAAPIKTVVLGDSLSAGLGLSAADAFPAKLQKALRDKGIAVDIGNAGVSGDTASGGRDRLHRAVPGGNPGGILERG